jgi:hypothetical protein
MIKDSTPTICSSGGLFFEYTSLIDFVTLQYENRYNKRFTRIIAKPDAA